MQTLLKQQFSALLLSVLLKELALGKQNSLYWVEKNVDIFNSETIEVFGLWLVDIGRLC